jgi:hypothetical protein
MGYSDAELWELGFMDGFYEGIKDEKRERARRKGR